MKYKYAITITRWEEDTSDQLSILDTYISADYVIEFMATYSIESPRTVAVEEETRPSVDEVGIGVLDGKKKETKPGRKLRVCKNCGKPGHFAKSCPRVLDRLDPREETVPVFSVNIDRVKELVAQGETDGQIYIEMHDLMTARELTDAIESARNNL